MSKRAAQDRHEITDLLYGDMDSPVARPAKPTGPTVPRSRKRIAVTGLVVVLASGATVTALVVAGERRSDQNTADVAACEQFTRIDDATRSSDANQITAIAETVRITLNDSLSDGVSTGIGGVVSSYADLASVITDPGAREALPRARDSARAALSGATSLCGTVLADEEGSS